MSLFTLFSLTRSKRGGKVEPTSPWQDPSPEAIAKLMAKPAAQVESEEIIAHFPVGSRIDYLGRTFVVSRHRHWVGFFDIHQRMTTAAVFAEYLDDNGVVHEKEFGMAQMQALWVVRSPEAKGSIQDFARKHGLTINIDEIYLEKRYTARFHHCDTKEHKSSCVVESSYGNGPSKYAALLDYAKSIAGRWLVIDHQNPGNPEIQIPLLSVDPIP